MVRRSARHHSLVRIRALVLSRRFTVTGRVQRYMVTQAWDRDFLADCLCALKRSDLHKSVPDPLRPGSYLEVYRPRLNGKRMYVKLTFDEDGDVYVLSFCRDGDNH